MTGRARSLRNVTASKFDSHFSNCKRRSCTCVYRLAAAERRTRATPGLEEFLLPRRPRPRTFTHTAEVQHLYTHIPVLSSSCDGPARRRGRRKQCQGLSGESRENPSCEFSATFSLETRYTPCKNKTRSDCILFYRDSKLFFFFFLHAQEVRCDMYV